MTHTVGVMSEDRNSDTLDVRFVAHHTTHEKPLVCTSAGGFSYAQGGNDTRLTKTASDKARGH